MPEKNCAIKFGGNVMPIQWGLDNDGKVVKDGNSFIFQINEICMKDISFSWLAVYMFMEKLKVISHKSICGILGIFLITIK